MTEKPALVPQKQQQQQQQSSQIERSALRQVSLGDSDCQEANDIALGKLPNPFKR